MDKTRNVNVRIPEGLPNPFIRLKNYETVKHNKNSDSPILTPEKHQADKSLTFSKNEKSKECANCLVVFEDKIRKISAISDKDVNQKDIPIPIKEALAFIFESTGKENFELESSTFLKESSQIFLCLKCAQTLNKLFKAFKDFTMLGNDYSIISQKLKKLRESNASNKGPQECILPDIDIKEEPDEELEDCDYQIIFENPIIKTERDTCTISNVKTNSNCFEDVVQNLNISNSSEKPEDKTQSRMSTRSISSAKQDVSVVKPLKPVLNCSNCSISFTEKNRKISAISVKGENGKDTPVSIKTALGFIFESVGDVQYFKRKVCVFLTTPSNSQLYLLCLNCALSLGKLYKTFHHFFDREAVNSEISEKVKLLRVYKYNSVYKKGENSGANCSNCTAAFNGKNRKISAISVCNVDGKNIPVPIKNALAYVLELKGKNRNISVFLNDSETSMFSLCLDCALSLGNLYNAFQHFTDLGVLKAEISEKLKELRILNYKNAISKIETDSKLDCSSLSQECSSSSITLEIQEKNSSRQKVTKVDYKKNIASNAAESEKSESECTTDDETYQSEIRTKLMPLKGDSHKCVLCDKVFSRKSWLLSHILVRHTEKSTWQCSVCQKRFHSNKKLKMHMYSHNKSEKPPFSCVPCNKYFLTELCFKTHEFRVHLDEKKCNICHKVFYTNRSMHKHLRKCKIQKFNFTCRICETEFPSKNDTIVHLEIHNGQGPWECSDCDKTFNMAYNFQEHVKTHFFDGERDHCCSICGIKVSSLAALNRHEELHADNATPIPRPFKCTHENCNLAFKSKSNLERHQRLHLLKNQEKSFQCSIANCGKLFLTASNLRQHEKVHSDLKTNVCDYCGKAFNYLGNLRTHIKNMHSKKALSST